MRTDRLIEMLARGAGPAKPAVAARRLAPAAAAGLGASVLLALAVLGPVPVELFATPGPWFKLGYAGALALAAGWLTARLARPVPRLAGPCRATLAVALLVAGLAGLAWAVTPQAERIPELMGSSWAHCPWLVAALSLPALAASLWAVRGLAPTRPVLAGAAAGLFAGALGAFGYALACTEPALTFTAVWYSLGIALSSALGALLGPHLLRW